MADIGFELYTQMLEEAIAGLKGEDLEERCEPEINLAIAAFIPETYIPDTNPAAGPVQAPGAGRLKR